MAWGCDRALNLPEETRPPGWVELGREFSLVDDVEYPKNKEVTSAIKVFWPKLIPMMCRWVFLSPADQGGNRFIRVFRYHAAGEFMEHMEPHQIPLEVPPDYDGVIPNRLVWVFDQGEGTSPAEKFNAPDLPGAFEPWDWALYYKVRDSFVGGLSAKDLKSIRERVNDQKQREIDSRQRDFAADFESFQRWAQKKLESASEDEINAMLQRSAQTERRHSGRLVRI